MTLDSYYFPMTPERDRHNRMQAAEKIRQRSKANREAWEELPGLEGLEGRELLAWFRTEGADRLLIIAQSRPDVARALVVKYGELVRRYG